MLVRIAVSALAALLLHSGSALAAQTINVSRFDDPDPSGSPDCNVVSCSLREAVQFAEGPSFNTVALSPGTYELTRGELVVNGSLLVTGAGARKTTVEQLKPGERVIDVRPPAGSFGLTGVTVTGGSTNDSTPFEPGGAGIRAENVGVGLTNDAIVGNHAYSAMPPGIAFGGGIQNYGTMLIKGTTVANNHATSNGAAAGGISDLQTMYVDDSTIAKNGATIFDASGTTFAVGGVNVGFASGALLSTASVTVAGNRASGGTTVNAGNLLLPSPSTEFRSLDTIYANGAGDPGHENCSIASGALIKSRGYNLQDRGQQCGLAKTGDLTGANPLLAALANNGGPTDTLALGPGSAAIDRGSPGACPDSGSSTLAVDQRGKPRVQGGRCDIGAFESSPGPPPKVSGLKVNPSSFHRGKGAAISYVDSEKATSTLTVLRQVRGIRKGSKCVPPPKKKPSGGKKPKRCTLTTLVGSFSHADIAGFNSFHWNGKVKGKALGAGRYRLQVVAQNAQGRKSATVTAGFKVVR